MDTTDIDTLLSEARLLAHYALRIGKVSAANRLFSEIEKVTLARERNEQLSVTALADEIEKVSKTAGVTIEQLLQRDSPAGRWRQHIQTTTPFLVGLMTLLLTLYLAFQSSELHKADLALREYQELVSERMPEKIYLAWKMYRYEDVLNAKGPPLAQLDGYQKLVDDAKRLYERRAAISKLLIDSAVIRYVPELFQDHGPCWLRSVARVLNSDERKAAPECLGPAVEPVVKKPPEIDKCLKLRPVSAQAPNATDATNATSATNAAKAAKAKTPAATPKLDLDDYELGVSCFLKSLQIANYDAPLDPMIYASRNKVHLLVSWLLPGLYGLLGACVYVMRALLRHTGHHHGLGDARIVDMLSLLLRVSLGGLAGIIIGWFSVPTGLSASSSAPTISSIPFGIAFLAGYGIETLFAQLDRLNKTLNQGDDRRTTASGNDTKNAV